MLKPDKHDPIIAGLLKRLPKSGEVWPTEERKLWLQLLEGSFKLIYQDGPSSAQRMPPPPEWLVRFLIDDAQSRSSARYQGGV